MKLKVFVLAVIVAFATSCGSDGKKDNKNAKPQEDAKAEPIVVDPMQDKGIGPVKSITLGEIDQTMADAGKEIFKAKCSA